MSRRLVFKKQEEDFINFLAEKCENAENPLEIKSVCGEFSTKFGSKLPYSTAKTRVNKYREKIHSMKNMDLNTKVKQIFGLSARMDLDFLEKLRQNANINVDEKNRIVSYESHDGSLKLKGNHDSTTKRWLKTAEKKRNAPKNARGRPKKQKPIPVITDTPEFDDLYDDSFNQSNNGGNNVKLETFTADLIGTRMETIDDGEDYIEEIFEETSVKGNDVLIPKQEIIHQQQQPKEVKVALPNVSWIQKKKIKEEIEEINQQKLLDSLHTLIISLELKSLKELESQIESKIKNSKKNFASKVVFKALEPCLFIVTNCDEAGIGEESYSLKDFLLLFRQFIVSLKSESLDGIKLQINDQILKLSIFDKKVPVEKIKMTLVTASNLLSF